MTYDRRPDRRSGGGRPPAGRPGGGRSDRPPRPQENFGDRRGGYGQRSAGGPPPGGRSFDRGSYAPRSRDEGGMSIRLDPRRLAALKLLAGEEGLRPGELVTRWVEERLDAARAGQPAPTQASTGDSSKALAALSSRVDELARRLDAFTATPPAAAPSAAAVEPTAPGAEAAEPVTPKRRGRPPRSVTPASTPKRERATAAAGRVALHDEIVALISERGPMTAAELATAIQERGRYSSPRSAKPFDASTVNARVSNPVYRSRFTRDRGRIGLATSS